MDVSSLFTALSHTEGVLRYLGILQDKMAHQLDLLSKSEFEAGLRALQQASRSQEERTSLLREARNRFNQALSLETGLRLAWAQLGLALCHHALGDTANAKEVLLELLEREPKSRSLLGMVPGVGRYVDKGLGADERSTFLELQAGARDYLFPQHRK
jgi:tetratricopeptide (TPR) repeat protein